MRIAHNALRILSLLAAIAFVPLAYAKTGFAIVDVETGKVTFVKSPSRSASRILSVDEPNRVFNVMLGFYDATLLPVTFDGEKKKPISLKHYGAVTDDPFLRNFAHSPVTGDVAWCSFRSVYRFGTSATQKDTVLTGNSLFFPRQLEWRTPTEIVFVHGSFEAKEDRIDVIDTTTAKVRNYYTGSDLTISEHSGSLKLSPSGEKFLFTDAFAPKSASESLKVLDFDDATVTTIAEGAVEPTKEFRYGAWHPGELKVAYVAESVTHTPKIRSEQEKADLERQLESAGKSSRPNSKRIQRLVDELDQHQLRTRNAVICEQSINPPSVNTIFDVPADLSVWGLTYLDENRLAMLTQSADDEKSKEKSTLWAIDIASRTATPIAREHLFAPLFSVMGGKKIICILETPPLLD